MADEGVSTAVIGKALNHLSPATTAVYTRLSQRPVRDAKVKAIGAIIEAGRQVG
jgi:hypothetical protein